MAFCQCGRTRLRIHAVTHGAIEVAEKPAPASQVSMDGFRGAPCYVGNSARRSSARTERASNSAGMKLTLS
jgi:hypothetical protein